MIKKTIRRQDETKKGGGGVSASFAQLLGGSDFPQLIKFVNKAVSLADAEMAY